MTYNRLQKGPLYLDHQSSQCGVLVLSAKLHNTFPLQYRLSSVVSLSGPSLKKKGGHYIASVRGPGPTPMTCILGFEQAGVHAGTVRE
jgi:hypothetical protein